MSAREPLIHVVDDDAGVLKALGRLLAGAGREVQAHSSAEQFLRRRDPARPGCAIVDLGLPGMDGFGVQDALAAGPLACPVIFLTGTGDIPASVRAMKAGAIDFLTKPVSAPDLLAAVDRALQRDAEARAAHAQRQAVLDRLATLTPREREVLDQVVAGKLSKQIAGELGTAEKTIKVHRGRMMKKLRVRTLADLILTIALHRR